eukprot:TRINITY_DN2350_c0_g1_i2.p2 TRINITY_DN2350_c0_g1~~TRINITY_DN2350_c0_g1_i2.p2  ORF type:complete len:179 (-),score=26.69 TRINITY_DN2350_c0_g1_i2:117-653(-)
MPSPISQFQQPQPHHPPHQQQLKYQQQLQYQQPHPSPQVQQPPEWPQHQVPSAHRTEQHRLQPQPTDKSRPVLYPTGNTTPQRAPKKVVSFAEDRKQAAPQALRPEEPVLQSPLRSPLPALSAPAQPTLGGQQTSIPRALPPAAASHPIQTTGTQVQYKNDGAPVSYTHLTLPTIYSV